jgi:hypothetical protein
MIFEKEIVLDDNAIIPPMLEDKKRESKLGEIVDKISDSSCPPVDISRLISLEIALVLNEQTNAMNSNDPIQDKKIKHFEVMVKSLRQLGQQLNDTEVFSKKDVLNFDGRKFQWVVQEIIKLFKNSIIDSGCDEVLANSVLKNFRDLFTSKEQEFRQGVDKIDSSVGGE